jgi:hypothetical protein
MSADDKEPAISVFVCGAKCDAGGTDEDGGHVFDRDVQGENFSCGACRCGVTNMDHAMWSDWDVGGQP